MTTAYICIGLLALPVFLLGLAISMNRGKDGPQTMYGTPPDPSNFLHKLIRAHGNTTEFAPMLAVLIYVAAIQGPATWVLWMMWIATAGRYVMVIGLIVSPTLEKPHPLRIAGALSTYVAGTALAVAVLTGAAG